MLLIPFIIFLFSLTWGVYSLYTLPTPPPLVQINRAWPSPIPSPSLAPTVAPTPRRSEVGTLSETSLFQALLTYRKAHSRNSITFSEELCRYARERSTYHLERLANLKAGESPLDNHAGFQADADSGALFAKVGGSFNSVAEVLAYLPNAANPAQVIEWGWDSSPTHREGLLSNDMTHACITGTSPIFVGILGR